MQPVTFAQNLQEDTDRHHSPAIWGDCPISAIRNGSIPGIHFKDDFDNFSPAFTVPTTEGNYGIYKAFTSTGGTIKPATQVRGGVITLGSDGDDEGASIATVNNPFKIVRADGKFWFEARIKVDTIAVTKYDAFIGLGENMTLTATVPITATAGAMADKNFVGFLRPGTSTTGDGSILRFCYKADGVTAVTIEDVASTFEADTWLKVGMTFDPGDNYLRAYVNNEVRATKKLIPTSAGTDFPNDVMMGLLAACLNTAAITSLFSIDWWEVAQLDA